MRGTTGKGEAVRTVHIGGRGGQGHTFSPSSANGSSKISLVINCFIIPSNKPEKSPPAPAAASPPAPPARPARSPRPREERSSSDGSMLSDARSAASGSSDYRENCSVSTE